MIAIKGALSSVTVHSFASLWWQVVASMEQGKSENADDTKQIIGVTKQNKRGKELNRRSLANTLRRVLTESTFCYGVFCPIRQGHC
ncbi:hypothetical protein T4C_7979 [Trichinella pseudospiralis]|uniref:Uncharacterized protein n=1 Tax=Trichinella pseudospiralis TaxID=6337 RepID=A0A0V1JUY1_TRIPS|nr:hypothetical protein T4C_6221 [Trichinella pseudospiralis]KRZ38779.1 hypothetical protein T4C_7979 [Trichinella pseudospiralis]